MAGSRKGERRGGRQKRTPNQTRFDPKTGTIKPKSQGRPKGAQSLMTIEREHEMMRIITGLESMLPKECQLTAMREFMEVAQDYRGMMRLAVQTEPRDAAHAAQLALDFNSAEREWAKYTMMATQVARDAAPYIHPRLAALAVTTDRNTGGDLFDLLLQEIDQTPRLRVIEHRKNEDEEAA